MNLIFCDTETTGLDEQRDHILEIALVAVELPTFTQVASFEALVLPPQWPTVRRNLHERVIEMHTKTGLLAALDKLHEAGVPPNAKEIEAAAVEFVWRHAPKTPTWHTPLAGAGPDFDRRFIRRHMPALHGKFHYRNFDVRSITQLQDWVFGVQHVESPHTALADCLQAIAAVRAFLGVS